MYDRPFIATYHFAAAGTSIASAAVTQRIGIPYRARGARVLDINARIATTYDVAAAIQVGISGTLAKFASLAISTGASPTVYSGAVNGASPWVANWDYNTDNLTYLTVTFTKGSATAGATNTDIIIAWDFIG